MKNWNTPEVAELDVKETAHKWTGIYKDGGYIGDGVISGHLSWDKPEGGNGGCGGNGGNGGNGGVSEPENKLS